MYAAPKNTLVKSWLRLNIRQSTHSEADTFPEQSTYPGARRSTQTGSSNPTMRSRDSTKPHRETCTSDTTDHSSVTLQVPQNLPPHFLGGLFLTGLSSR